MRKLLHVSTVNIDTVDETIVGTKLTPRLLIPREPSYQEGESRHHFPGFHAIMARRDVEHVQIVDEFAQAISASQSRVWIIDKHIFSEDGEKYDHSNRIQRVADWFLTEQLKSVRILTSGHKSKDLIESKFAELEELVTNSRGKIGTPIEIKILFSISDFNHIHDRFAIIDDELWHFGATVGGFHRGVNAVSRGWDANTHKAVEFFDLAWDRSNTKSRKSA
ncbi:MULTISPECIES: hypothetical protein [Pseudomonas syringae group]|uniref:hypothetical protein n=1 Tax=Pseudomonas syringae group TaxID=136849 RepID=UPI001F13E401|nr:MULTISPECIES: hypothetical protein [Pseudomonas syringae group]